MFKKKLVVAVSAALCLVSGAANADSITTLYNTGVGANGVLLANGTVGDPHYTLFSSPLGSGSVKAETSASGWPIGNPWLGDNTASRWIGPNTDSAFNGPVGTYIYRTTFSLTGFNAATASISGKWATDNEGLGIVINGNSTGNVNNAQFVSWTSFSINSGFVAGLNTLDFIVQNGGGPTGLRVEMTGTAAPVPEPETYAMLLAGLGLVGGIARRRKAAQR